MTIYILSAFTFAFLLSFLFGKWFVPWLSERNVTQPLKEAVEKEIYLSDEGNSEIDS